jgi:formylglycine-generating enzyme required for sulfatase activity
MPFRYCPAGTFLMGDTDRRSSGRGPVRVTISQGFWMGRHEVTQGQWREVMGRTLREQRAQDPRQPRPVGDGTMREHVGEGPEHPIYYVSHVEAESFCRAMTEAERAAGRLPQGWSYRLPTEAQWEYACRAGTTTATAFGDSLDSTRANFDGRYPYHAAEGPFLRETTPGGTYPPNAWGLCDMHGNVCEWTRDAYSESLPGGDDPIVLDAGPMRVFRDGGWDLRGFQCLSAHRSWGPTDTRGSGLGFRVALVPDGH